MIISLIRYGVALYGLLLEAFYPFDTLPFAITISDGVKESLKSQARAVISWSAIVSLSFILLFFYLLALFTSLRCALGLFMRLRPDLKEIAKKRVAERKAKREAENKKKPSKLAVLGRILSNLFFSIAMIINDAVFNRAEDAASYQDGVYQRFQLLRDQTRPILRVQIVLLTFIFVFAAIFTLVRAMVRQRRQQRAAARASADEESRLAPGEMVEVEAQQIPTRVLDEKLIDLSDSMDVVYEKMESYAAPSDATKQNEEPLIKL
ncbi:hypothetical protein GYMLUDRAFT_241230 [Collybiopsis luxurians FD-317 M1]|uniref:Uncharacterized protein n=1 Tax=Collybiopsis luxurians FD-317 M1 TaxID=944289 RepID=A0A0D0D403_9AGAR|nr:hypothetical protein GYMLUDRAFT_241230 [Collybiopsis luxurians FD-317 M1]